MAAPQTKSLRSLIAGTYGAQLVLLPLAFGTSAMQARLLGPAGRGQLATLLTVAATATLYLGLGMSSAVTYFVASSRIAPRTLRAPLLRLGAVTTAVLFAALALVIVTGQSQRVLGTVAEHVAAATVLALFVLLTHNSLLSAILGGRRAFQKLNATSVLTAGCSAAAYSVASVLAPASASRIYIAIGIQVGVELLRGGMLAYFVWAAPDGEEANIPPVASPLRAMMKFSLLAYACDAVHFLSYRFDVWLVRAYGSDFALGQYDLAVRLGELVWLLSAAVAAVLFPTVASLEREQAIRVTCRLTAFALVASAGLGLAGFLVAIPLLPRIFSSSFAPATALLGILLIGIIPMSAAKVVGNYLAGSGGMRFSLYSAIIAMVTCITLDFALIPTWKASGAAVAASIAYITFTVVLLSFAKHSTGHTWATLWSYTRSGNSHAG